MQIREKVVYMMMVKNVYICKCKNHIKTMINREMRRKMHKKNMESIKMITILYINVDIYKIEC